VRVSGGYQLTPKGIDYFKDRYNRGNRQYIERAEVDAMIYGITTGSSPGWTKII
jgi:hypothetical protein